jgi:hypothetical protein
MTDISVAKPTLRSPFNRAGITFAAAVALTVIADWLFYRHPVGISWAVFVVVVAAATVALAGRHASGRDLALGTGMLIASLAPTVEHFGWLSVLSSLAGLTTFALIVTDRFAGSPAERAVNAVWLFLSGPSRFGRDLRRHAEPALRASRALRGEWLIAWLLPVLLGLVFVGLFASANPLIERWLGAIRLDSWLGFVEVRRIVFWLIAAALVWPFLRVRVGLGSLLERFPLPRLSLGLAWAPEALFGRRAVVRSLVLFNALFAVQTVLDLAYLWGGVALPDDLSYAGYAHRGAYPLILTALLAAAFVLAAMRPGSETERDKLVRGLVFLWVGQNVLLVLSSILRLDLYVEAYALTGLRVAALIWMVLVAFGLVLVIVRIAFRRTNGWLVAGNLLALGVMLYASAFVNFPRLIAEFNVSHSREVSGEGVFLDGYHLCRLGPEALPAIERYLAAAGRVTTTAEDLAWCSERLVERHRQEMGEWRAWSWRDQRLASAIAS